MKTAALVLLTLTAPLALASMPKAKPSLEEVRQKQPCNDSIDRLLKNWAPQATWVEVVPPSDDSRAFRSPGREIGTSIELVLYEDGSTEAIRKTANTALMNRWTTDDCTAQLVLDKQASPKKWPHPVFTDEDVKKVLADNPKGIIYAWSPHMALSLKALPELRKAAQKLGMTIVPVLDPYADPGFSKAEAKKNGLTTADLRRIESVEVLSRGVNLHYPSMLIFANGKFAQATISGYKEAAHYETVLNRELATIR